MAHIGTFASYGQLPCVPLKPGQISSNNHKYGGMTQRKTTDNEFIKNYGRYESMYNNQFYKNKEKSQNIGIVKSPFSKFVLTLAVHDYMHNPQLLTKPDGNTSSLPGAVSRYINFNYRPPLYSQRLDWKTSYSAAFDYDNATKASKISQPEWSRRKTPYMCDRGDYITETEEAFANFNNYQPGKIGHLIKDKSNE